MSEEPLVPGRSYLARIGTKTAPATITAIKHKIDVNTRKHLAANTLGLNDIAFCNLSTSVPVAFDPYAENRQTGAFIIIDRFTNHTVGAGMIAFGLRRGTNIHWQPLLIGKAERAALKHQRPAMVWFTGLSGAGKSTIANIVEQKLHPAGHHTMMLDGDNVRHGLNRDLGFTEADRVENIRRVGEVAKLMTECGLVVLCSFISPYRAERDMVRGLVGGRNSSRSSSIRRSRNASGATRRASTPRPRPARSRTSPVSMRPMRRRNRRRFIYRRQARRRRNSPRIILDYLIANGFIGLSGERLDFTPEWFRGSDI